jgi:hypothetical protein
MSTTHSVDILVSQEFYLSMDLYQDFNWKTVLIKWPNGLTSSLLIMFIILKSRYERKEFSWLQRFRWFWSSFSSNFYGIEILCFTKSDTMMSVCHFWIAHLPTPVHYSSAVPVFHTGWSDYILTTTTPKITTQCPFFAPGLIVVEIKFAVQQNFTVLVII